jgi:polyhydroxyalkanoate synthesis regulator phasin
MVFSHLKKGIKIGIKAVHMSARQLEAELRPLIRAGHLTAKDARAVAGEARKLGAKAKSKAIAAGKLEARKLIGKMGYMSKAEGDSLKRRISELEKKLKSKKRK